MPSQTTHKKPSATAFKRSARLLGKSVLGLAGFMVVYGLCIKFVPYIQTGAPSSHDDVTIYLLSNGVHTDFVVPTTTAQKDWSATFRPELVRDGVRRDWLAIGWGDKGFYLNTPTWAELKASTALWAVSGFSSSAIHTTYYDEQALTACDKCAKITISQAQYQTLIEHIEEALDTKNAQPIFITTDAVYGDSDAFYEGQGSYFLTYTCNTWVNVGLQKMGLPAALWTVTDTGIFQHYVK